MLFERLVRQSSEVQSTVRKERSIIMGYPSFLLLFLMMSTSFGELNSGPMPNAVNGVIVSFSHPASDKTVDGFKVYEVTNETYSVTYSMINEKCTLGTGVMGMCWIDPGKDEVVVIILVSGLAEGERRTFRFKTHKNDEGNPRWVHMDNITVSGPKKRTDETSGAKTDEIGAREIVAWVMVALLALAVCICGFLWLAYRRGVFKERPSPAEARAAARSMTASHRRSGSGSR